MRQLVLKNQVVLGSVNASPEHIAIAVSDLAACREKWPKAIEGIITEKIPYREFSKALQDSVDEIKVLVDWE